MIIVSLFDESGNMLRPWAADGYVCFAFDILNDGRIERFTGGGCIIFVKGDLWNKGLHDFIVMLKPAIIFGFPPCTDVATLGAKHFAKKLIIDPLIQWKAVALARIVETIGDRVGCPWFVENPISMFASLWRKPDFYFHPWEYGGYLPINDIHPKWPEFIAPRDAYSKRTCLWVGGGFEMPFKLPVVPIYTTLTNGKQGSHQWKMLGGKSAKTKQIRSETPRGFALAVKIWWSIKLNASP